MGGRLNVDAGLLDYCTPRQRQVLEAIIEADGNGLVAAEKVGFHKSMPSKTLITVQKKAAQLGYAPGHWDSGVAPGYRMGKVTVQRGRDGVERVWERQHPEYEQAFEAMREAIESYSKGIPAALPADAPALTMSELQAWYIAGDPHFGMLAWARESGEDHDLSIARERMLKAVDLLIESAPQSKTAVLLNVGDAFHSNNSRNRTEGSGNVLDVDGRMSKIFEMTLETWGMCIDKLLLKHERVECINIRGNHDPDISLLLAYALRERYRNEPRVEIPICDRKFQYRRFGKTLVCLHHGDGVKPADLPGIMLADVPLDVGETEFRYWWLGHIHHKLRGQEVNGAEWETFNTLAGRDSWHDGKGYRARQRMQTIILHEYEGEWQRNTCDLVRIKRKQDRATSIAA
jgi:hypothetical protein